MTFDEITNKITSILRANGIEYAALFGSTARGEVRPDSDVDILVHFGRKISLLDHIGVAYELEDVLQKKVDLVTEYGLNQRVAPYIKQDLKILYGSGQRQDLL